jgi:hypothetical protein
METNQFYFENIGIGLLNVSNLLNLDLKLNEYLVVGQRNNANPANTLDYEYNMIVNNNGVGINATRRELLNTNAGLLVNNNIICKGKIMANSIEFQNFTLSSNVTNNDLINLVNKVNSNLFFFNGYNNQGLTNTIYTPSYLSIGNFNSTFSNAHALKISDTPIGSTSNIQFAIYNQTNNTIEQARFTFGMIGINANSPANIITTKGMPLEFHISKNSTKVDELYSNGLGFPSYVNKEDNFPQLAIDANGTVNINKNKCDLSFTYNNIQMTPKLNVNGAQYANDIYMYDRVRGSNYHIHDIFMHKTAVTLNPNQIYGGDFAKTEFTFNSNVNIGKNNDEYLLTVNNSALIKKNLTTDSLNSGKTVINGTTDLNGIAYFNSTAIFNENISINKNLNIGNDLFIGGVRINTSNFNFAVNGLNFDYQSNLSVNGRLGTGVFSIDTYDHQFNILKRNRERFEIYMNDMSGITTDSSKVFIGHTDLNNINGNVDNSLIFLTQKNIRWHNIYFYPGKDRFGNNGLKNISPTLAIMENNKIGINTNLPSKTLDIIGDLITTDYYIRKNNSEFKINPIIINNNDNSILNVKNLDINLIENQNYNNKKTLNITGGINSYNGYFDGDSKLASFYNYDNFNIASVNSNVGIGVIKTDNSFPVPLQVRNFNNNFNNNSIIRLYRGIRGGSFNNDALYTGIDFCDYDLPLPTQNRNNFKWFMYKNHRSENIPGVLQIGYTNNSVNPTHSCMNFYYNDTTNKYFIDINNPNIDYTYNKNNAVSIKGNVEINGNLNLVGENSTYNINGVIIGSFSNPAVMRGTSLSTNYNFQNENINDISVVANKIGLLPSKTVAFGFNKDDWIYKKLNVIQTTANEDNSLSIFYNNKDYINDYTPPIITKFYNKSFRNYNYRPDIAIIQHAIIQDNSDTGNILNKVDFKLKGYSDVTIYEITPNDKTPYITFINKDNKNQVNIGNKSFYSGNSIIYPSVAVHINDDFDCLLKLTNVSKPVKIELANDTNVWSVAADNKLDISFINNSLFNITSNGQIIANNYSFINNKNYETQSTINLNSIPNRSTLECTNFYYNDYKNTNEIIDGRNGFIQTHYSNIETKINENYYDSYDDLTDTAISRFIYGINDSNLPLIDINNNPLINYTIINSNKIHNDFIDLNFKLTPRNLILDYKFLNNIEVNSNNNSIKLIPTLNSYDNNVNAFIKTSNNYPINYSIDNFNFNLNYLLPKTTNNDDLVINSRVIDFNKTSNYNNLNYYNINLQSFINVKNNPNLANYLIKTITNSFLSVNNNTSNYLNISNKILYYPFASFPVDEIELNLKYKYNYRNDINIPSNFYNNYNNSLTIANITTSNAIINNSNTYLTQEIKGSLDFGLSVNIHPIEIICSNLSSNVIKKLYPIEINNNEVTQIELGITKNNYFDFYVFDPNYSMIPIPILINNYKPHLTLKNYINSRYSAPHKIYSYENKYEIHLGNSKLLSLDSNGNLNTNGSMNVKDIYISGDIYNTTGNNLTSVYSNLIGSNFNINKTNISLNSSNLFLNPSVMNYGGVIINRGDIYNSNNLFEINNYNNNDNFVTLKSITDSALINFFGTCNLYKLGSSNGNFGIWKTNDPNTLTSSYIKNDFNNFSNVINFDYSGGINKFPIIYLNGAIKSTSNLSINDMHIYHNNDLNYKVRVYGNMKVDGTVMSSSDIRIKTEIKKIDNALDKICKLNGITYENKTNGNRRETGLIAQEVKEIIPEAVYEDERGYLNIAYGNLMGIMVEAIKEIKLLIK